MPRTARTVIDGGTYHVLTRGNNGQIVFHHDADFQRYLQVLSAQMCEYRLALHHFVLMPNHVHLLVTVSRAEALSRAMLSINLGYSLYYRKRYQYSGHLWQGRFKSLLIDRERDLLECGRYIELNPVRAGLVRTVREYPWSSYRVYAEGADNPLVTLNPVYETLGASMESRQQRYRVFAGEGLKLSPAPPSLTHDGRPDPFTDPIGFTFRPRRRGRPRKLEAALDES